MVFTLEGTGIPGPHLLRPPFSNAERSDFAVGAEEQPRSSTETTEDESTDIREEVN